MKRSTKISVLMPTHFAGVIPDPNDFLQWSKSAEDLGFSSIWILDRIYHSSKVPDAMTMLAWTSAVTTRIRLGTAVLLLPHRNPLLLAKEVATLDYLSKGRVDLGVGLGGKEVEFQSLGLKMEQRLKRFHENLGAMRSIWTGPGAQFDGKFVNFKDVNVEPRPMLNENIPIWIGGEAEGVLKRTAKLADGWIGGAKNSTADLKDKIHKIKTFAKEQGRDPESLGYASLEYLTLEEDTIKARKRMHQLTGSIYGQNFDTDSYTTFGDLDKCVSRIQEVVAAGCNEVIIGVPDLELQQISRIAHELVPNIDV